MEKEKIKKSFVLYSDFIETLSILSDEEAGILFKTIFKYVNDIDISDIDRMTQITFEPIKQQLLRDGNKYEKIKERRKIAGQKGGKKSGEARRSKPKQTEANEASASKSKQTQANEAVNVNVNGNVNDNGNVNVNDINKRKGLAPKPPKFNPKKYLLEKGAKESYIVDWLETRKTKLTESAVKKFETEAGKANKSIAEAVQIVAENSWQSFQAKYLENKTLNYGKSEKDTAKKQDDYIW